MENDPKDNVDVTAEDELSEEMIADVSGGMDWKRSPG
jgi:hypothetical protein